MDETEEHKALHALATMDLVNEKAKTFLENKLGRMFAAKQQHAQHEHEEQEELNEVKAMDKVNENIKGLLNEKLMKMFLMSTLENEEKEDLKKVAKLDKVNAESISNMENLLANKMAAQ